MTITPELKSLHSPDVDLETFRPQEEPECFGFLLQAFFGPTNERGKDSFDMMVCTPVWFEQRLKEWGGVLTGRHYLFVERYDLEQIKKYLLKYLRHCTGETWSEVAEKLGRIGHWEFEDYQAKNS